LEELITASKAAKQIGVTPPTVLNWFKKGLLPGKRMSGMVWVKLEDVQKVNREYSLKRHQRRRFLEV
jgi:hypothetical protein